MRSLAQPAVLRNAAIASAISAMASFPRLQAWQTRRYPVWYLEAVLFLGGIVLWAFVFGWHTKYSHRPVLKLRPDRTAVLVATAAGLAGALVQFFYLDPILRARTPEDFPSDAGQWLALTLFTLTFSDLFMVFAPFDWLLRLSRSPKLAAGFTVAFGLFVLWLKNHNSVPRLPEGLFSLMLGARALTGVISVYLYMRGGILLVCWSHLLIEARHLFHLHG